MLSQLCFSGKHGQNQAICKYGYNFAAKMLLRTTTILPHSEADFRKQFLFVCCLPFSVSFTSTVNFLLFKGSLLVSDLLEMFQIFLEFSKTFSIF